MQTSSLQKYQFGVDHFFKLNNSDKYQNRNCKGWVIHIVLNDFKLEGSDFYKISKLADKFGHWFATN